MLSVDRDALLCDMAETYGIYDLNALPVETLAALSFGLPAESRIRTEAAGIKSVGTMQLLASIADSLIIIRHFLTGDDRAPVLFQPEMYADVKRRPEAHAYKFASSEDFKKFWSSI